MTRRRPISRRTALRGLGAMVALPWLESMAVPAKALGATSAAAAGKPPLRMGVLYVPNGVNTAAWRPKEVKGDWELSPTLTPLKDYRQDLLVFSGLSHPNAAGLGDGAGDHARASAAFLTGMHPYKTAGKDIRAGVSADQRAAQTVGGQTRVPSLELALDSGAQAGACDTGYSCAYSSHIAWAKPNEPLPTEINPRSVFNRLFAVNDSVAAAKQAAYRRSILDLVSADARRLRDQLGSADQQKLQQYLESVRELEKQIQATEKSAAHPAASAAVVKPEMAPRGIPADHAQHVRLMLDLMALAYQTDSTRVITFLIANESSNRTYPQLGIRDGHHELSHHDSIPEKLAKIQKIDQFNVGHLAYLLGKLKAIPEGEGTLLDHCMILYGGCIADGNSHAHYDLPMLLAGRGGGTLSTGRYIQTHKGTPACNLLLSMLHRMGAKDERFGDSTGQLKQLTV